MKEVMSSSDKSTIGRSNKSQPLAVPVIARAAFGTLSRLAPGPASKVAERVFLKPQRFRRPHRETWWETDAEAWQLPFAGGELQAWRWGWGGDTVLLVHGWSGRGLQLGAWAEPLVERDYQVVAFDAPAHGRSDGQDTTLPEFADAISAMVRQVGGVSAIVAHSFGAVATTAALAADPDLEVGRLVYVAPPARLSSVLHRFCEMTGFSAGVAGRMQQRIEQRLGIPWQQLDSLELAPTMERPLLVIHDREDREVPWQEGETLARAWPRAQVLPTHGLGHHRILRDAKAVGRAVDFLTAEEF